MLPAADAEADVMSRAVGPGAASLAGLRWVASVGPAPLDAWGAAMGWAESTCFSHAARLVGAGLVSRCSTRRGGGSLYYATRAGVRDAGLLAVATKSPPAPSTWAHWSACAWTAAWLTSRGRLVVGSRELQMKEAWRDEVEWVERDGLRRRGHQPDLLAALAPEARWLPIEAELTDKSTNRLRSILALHAAWIAAEKTDAVIYVCSSEAGAERVVRNGQDLGLSEGDRTLRVETLETIRDSTIAVVSQDRPAHALVASGR